ncbi:FAD-dependent tricarballylate dehydrogenase TcuA [Rhodococcus rhodochrous]|uniref:FAD-dependent tricarballylate dehydrogenase TcuA n=1 Tax=Rhodococcus rhodochrous TaxID=1829 RepID=UPI00132EAF71|nr:FAD-dependent tricarballylate dehydrogenase TcuA [Rhodococcus rhodochrous]QHG80720.1 FAD-binding dehydrogenase [Rhodococcus rhodochrous]QOH55338.1 tricarballylate dehydrogenase [Rhodococcus rhodochrous]
MTTSRVIVVGAGNAALCAALAAREKGAEVLVLERADQDRRGGNTAFTAGAMRVAYDGVDDLRRLMPDLTDEEVANTDFGSYTSEDFLDDLARVTEYRTDPDLAGILVEQSYPTLSWMRDKGVKFMPIYGRQAFKVDGKFKFWGGLTVEVNGGGPGLVDYLCKAAEREGVKIEYGARVVSLIHGDDSVTGVRVKQNGQTRDELADAVVLASGGFQANTEWRTRYLGPSWDLAKVRGTMFNTGDGHKMALDIGASPTGNWSGCHAVGWERNAPEFGDLAVGDGFQKHSYPFGILVNAHGKRFVDEGADFRNYTYAKYGRRILEQPNQFAWQVFDQKVTHLLRDEYKIRQVTKVTAPTLEALAQKLEGVDPDGFLEEVRAYNAAVDTSVEFNPNVKDGRGTSGLPVNKTNWANTLDEGPFEAYQVTCGITFTFGGVRINSNAQVLDTDMNPISGLYAAGELVGGIFYFNYPGGSGLTNGSVFGRIAGSHAAEQTAAV